MAWTGERSVRCRHGMATGSRGRVRSSKVEPDTKTLTKMGTALLGSYKTPKHAGSRMGDLPPANEAQVVGSDQALTKDPCPLSLPEIFDIPSKSLEGVGAATGGPLPRRGPAQPPGHAAAAAAGQRLPPVDFNVTSSMV